MTIALTPTRASVPAGPISTPKQVVTTFTLTNATGSDSGSFALALTETNGGDFSYAYSINGGAQTLSGDLNAGAATPFSPANITGLDLAAAAVLTLVVTANVPFSATGGNYSFEIAWSGAGVTSGNSTSTVALNDPLAIENVPSTYTGSVGAQFEFTVSAFQGTTPYVFSAIGLPTGVTINSATGVVSGMPLAPGNYMATFTVTDASSVTNSANTTIIVWSDDVFEQDIPPKLFVSDNRVKIPQQQFWVVGQPITPIGVFFGGRNGFTAPFVYSATNLPAGISINSSTGLLSGTPIGELTNAPIVITITDANNLRYRAGFYALIVENSADASQQALQFGMDVKPQNGVDRQPALLSITQLADDTQAVMTAQYPSNGGGGGGASPFIGGTPPTIVQVGSAQAASADPSVVLTSAPVQGNLLVAFVFNTGTNPTLGSGWTAKQTNYVGNVGVSIFTKVAGASESATQTPSTAAAGATSTVIWEVHGFNSYDLFQTYGQTGNAASGSTSLFPVVESSLFLAAVAGNTATTITSAYGTSSKTILDAASGAPTAYGSSDSTDAQSFGLSAMFSSAEPYGWAAVVLV